MHSYTCIYMHRKLSFILESWVFWLIRHRTCAVQRIIIQYSVHILNYKANAESSIVPVKTETRQFFNPI